MSPVDQSRNHVGKAATVALVSVIVMGLGLWIATVALNRKPSTSLHLGDQTFQAGNAEDQAGAIAKHGPQLYADVSGRNERPIILQHLGTNPKKGWHAFLAFPPDQDANCGWEWQPKERLFRAACDHHRTAPADGKGLPSFPVTVTDGRLSVDLNAEARKSTTTTTTSSVPSSTPTTTAG